MGDYTHEQIQVILGNHAMYLRGETGGVQAVFGGVDFTDAYIPDADLRNAEFYGCDFTDAYMPGCDFGGATLAM